MPIQKCLVEAVSIVERLQKWLEDRDGLSSVPVAHLSWSMETLQIRVSEFVVYCDQSDIGHLTFESCRNIFLEEIRDFEHFRDEKILTLTEDGHAVAPAAPEPPEVSENLKQIGWYSQKQYQEILELAAGGARNDRPPAAVCRMKDGSVATVTCVAPPDYIPEWDDAIRMGEVVEVLSESRV